MVVRAVIVERFGWFYPGNGEPAGFYMGLDTHTILIPYFTGGTFGGDHYSHTNSSLINHWWLAGGSGPSYVPLIWTVGTLGFVAYEYADSVAGTGPGYSKAMRTRNNLALGIYYSWLEISNATNSWWTL